MPAQVHAARIAEALAVAVVSPPNGALVDTTVAALLLLALWEPPLAAAVLCLGNRHRRRPVQDTHLHPLQGRNGTKRFAGEEDLGANKCICRAQPACIWPQLRKSNVSRGSSSVSPGGSGCRPCGICWPPLRRPWSSCWPLPHWPNTGCCPQSS